MNNLCTRFINGVTIMGSQGQRHTRNQQTTSGNDIIRFNKTQLHMKV